MEEEYGASYITIEDDEGQKFELEHLDTFQYEKKEYMVFLPADMDEDDPDYGLIILRVVEDESGLDSFESVDDEDELAAVYDYYMENLFDSEDEIPED